MGFFSKSEPKPQTIQVIEGGDAHKRAVKQAPDQMARWAKVMDTYKNGATEADRARYKKACRMHDGWSKIAEGSALLAEES